MFDSSLINIDILMSEYFMDTDCMVDVGLVMECEDNL
jgi:hypothetical protein